MQKKGHYVLAYLDDYAGCHAHFGTANKAYDEFVDLADHLGIKLAKQKCVRPSQVVEWLGFKINTVDMTISIPPKKLMEVLKECTVWTTRKRASKKMLQSILGRLIYVSSCVRQGRRFVSRIIDTLRGMGDRNWTTLGEQFQLDISWFCQYARVCNGIHLYSVDRPTVEIECDSSLTGASGVGGSFCYRWDYTESHTNKFATIHQLEAINVVVAYRTLAHRFNIKGARVVIFTDNLASAQSIESG